MIYFDNTATSFPKALGVTDAMVHFMENIGANPGRSGHFLSVEAARAVYDTREVIAELFSVPDPLQIVFTKNVTESLNLALSGILHPGDHVITSSMEHNSMMRPLRALEKIGLELTVVQCSSQGLIDPDYIRKSIKNNTVMIALNHASNVVGTIQPVVEIGEIASEYDLLFLLDAAQTAGCFPINAQTENIDLLAFTGHKSLLGPTGTGGLIIGDRVELKKFNPLIKGGTGSLSEKEVQPTFLPDMLESGTPNTVGLAGLAAAVRWVMHETVARIRLKERTLTDRMIQGLREIPNVTVYGTLDSHKQTSTVSFNIKGMAPSDIGLILDEQYQIMCRVGLHCSPVSHKTIGTFPNGTVRFGLGYFNTEQQVDDAVTAVTKIAMELK